MWRRPRTEAPLLQVHGLFVPRATEGDDVAFARRSTGALPRSRLAVLFLFVLFALWLLNVADLVVTIHWTGDAGWAAEGNRIMRAVATIFGTVGFIAYKILLMTFVVLALWWLYLRFERTEQRLRTRWHLRALAAMRLVAIALTLALATFYSWVVWNNLHIAGFL